MKSKFDWKEFEKKAELENQINEKLGLLREELIKSKKSPFNKETDEFSKDFEMHLNIKIKNILNQFQNFPLNEKLLLKNKFIKTLRKEFDLRFKKKAFCLIIFNSVPIFKFFQALSTIFNKIKIEIHPDKLYICELDPSRKVLVDISISNETYTFFKESKIILNTSNLNKALKAKKSDKSKTYLILGKDKLYIEINSQKFKSSIKRVLNYENQDKDIDIPINELNKVNYPCRFQLTKERLNYIKSNSGFYSDIIKIICNSNQIKFIEKGDGGKNEIIWENKKGNEIVIDFSILNTELAQLENDFNNSSDIRLQNQLIKLKEYIKKNAKNPEIKEKFLVNFLVLNLRMMSLLEETDIINFFLRDDNPLKSEIKIEELGDTIINFYLAPILHK
ncbi:MAG: hypothetical protein ACTSR8_05945 [Promethearchaeota archaeon]